MDNTLIIVPNVGWMDGWMTDVEGQREGKAVHTVLFCSLVHQSGCHVMSSCHVYV
jgi:hypothetical protein